MLVRQSVELAVKPYYEDELVTLFCGDAREVLSQIPQTDAAVITDPVWPNSVPELVGATDPQRLFTEVALLLTDAARLVVHLGGDSDPRFLAAVPAEFPFLRSINLEYVRPHYKGRMLYTHDVAYVFGTWPLSRKGFHVIPGRVIQNDAEKRPQGHPCPRQIQHVRWLVARLSTPDELVIDPFAGSGTTLVAAKQVGRRAVGIEIEERFCELTVQRLEQQTLGLSA